MGEIGNDVQRWHLAKADVYRTLSACYYEPEESFLEEDLFGQLEQALALLSPEDAADAQVMGSCFRDTDHEELRLDYARLFLGPVGIRAKPYGSVYLDGGNVVMGDSTLAALALYREGGFLVAEGFTEMPDHVAVELEFLYLLNSRLGNGLTESDERERIGALERSFLGAHLGRWITPFTQAVRKGADTDFYRKLADLTRHAVLHTLREPASAPRR
jgi:TorA maturation chaperone TorD